MDDGSRTSDGTRESGRTLAQEIIEAHGGMKRWSRVSSLRVDVAFAGFAFRMKFLRNLPYRGTMVVERAVQRLTFESFPVPGHRGVFEGAEVRIEAVDGRVVSRRLAPRTAFQDFRHRLWWDSLDLLYFAGQAGWNYLCVPFIFDDPSYEFEVDAHGRMAARSGAG